MDGWTGSFEKDGGLKRRRICLAIHWRKGEATDVTFAEREGRYEGSTCQGRQGGCTVETKCTADTCTGRIHPQAPGNA